MPDASRWDYAKRDAFVKGQGKSNFRKGLLMLGALFSGPSPEATPIPANKPKGKWRKYPRVSDQEERNA